MQPPPASCEESIRLGLPVPAGAMRSIERAMQLRHFKWDTQIGDDSVLCPQPLLIAQGTWDWLSATAEEATREIFALEQTVADDPSLQRLIGVPRALGKMLTPGASGNPLRTLRFDFHPTSAGWLLSEVNADVPGGFGEASALPAFFAPFLKHAVMPACPLTAWGNVAAKEIASGHAALLCAPGHLEDQQVVLTLARELDRRGFVPHLVQSPAALHWHDGWAYPSGKRSARLHLIVRFYQAEWLARLPRRTGWHELFKQGNRTRVCNPSVSAISESKRLPLVFGAAGTPCDTLRGLFPECREPAQVNGTEREAWVLKGAYSNTGDEVHIGAEMTPRVWDHALHLARRNPAGWVAQRRFETVAVASVRGPVKPCVGVFVIGSRAVGAYVRLSAGQVTNAHAMEAPLFILPDGRYQ